MSCRVGALQPGKEDQADQVGLELADAALADNKGTAIGVGTGGSSLLPIGKVTARLEEMESNCLLNAKAEDRFHRR